MNQWDEYAEIFDKGIGDGNESLHKDLIDPLIFNFLGKGHYGTILDAGCGNGYLMKRLIGRADSFIGLDYSDKLLIHARSRLKGSKNISLIKCDLMDSLPLETGSCDVMIANMVLQYLPSLSVFSSEAARLIPDKGLLIIIVDHPGHQLFARAQELAGKVDRHFIDKGSYFTPSKRRKNSLWGKAVLEYYHRPIRDYIVPFLRNFDLSEMEETTQDGEVPRLLGLKFHKKPR